MSYSDYNSNGASIITPNSDKVYADLDLKLLLHPAYNDIRPVTEIDAIKNSVRNLILTNRGERPFQPDVGCGIFDLLFENTEPYTITQVRDNVQDMLAKFEPRVKSSNVKVNLSDDGHTMNVTIEFTIGGVNSLQSIDFYLERLR